MVKEFDGNILDSGADIICHQVNCQGAMGAGLAKQIRHRWPMVYKHYKNFCDINNPYDNLGNVQLVRVSDKQYIANIFGQLNYGRWNVRYTDYDALRKGFDYLAQLQNKKKFRVAIPYGIGCGLAGGDWSVVRSDIDSAFCGDYADCEIWKL